jgi:hypothetical protein
MWYCTHAPSQAPSHCKQRAVCGLSLDDQPAVCRAASTEYSEAVECPMGLVGRIIGRGGETIKGLQVTPY